MNTKIMVFKFTKVDEFEQKDLLISCGSGKKHALMN